MKILKDIRGVALAEALMAAAMLVAAGFATATMLRVAVTNSALARDYLVAQNLATEGIEAVKSIRNANWLNKPDKPNCWLTLDPDTPEAECEAALNQVQADTSYRLLQKEIAGWRLEESVGGFALDLESGIDAERDQFQLFLDTGIEILGAEEGLKRYISLDDPSGNPDLNQEDSRFYRSVEFADIVPNESASFEVNIQWFQGADIRQLTREFTIYNSGESL